MRINGIGKALLGIYRTPGTNKATGTMWFTFLFLPIVPLARYKVEFLEGYIYRVDEFLPLDISEVISTYLRGLLLVPLIGLGPSALAVTENLELPYLLLSIIWFTVWFLIILFSYEKQMKPIKKESL